MDKDEIQRKSFGGRAMQDKQLEVELLRVELQMPGFGI